jgi:hypothetical protein
MHGRTVRLVGIVERLRERLVHTASSGYLQAA